MPSTNIQTDNGDKRHSTAKVHFIQPSTDDIKDETVDITWLEVPELRGSLEGDPSELVITPYNRRLPTWRTHEQDPTQERWSNRFEFITACLAFTIDVECVFLIPIEAVSHGSVDFLISYLILHVLFGVPLFFFETALGQFTGKGPAQVFEIIPIVKGLFYTIMIQGTYTALANMVSVAQFAFYFFQSFRSTVPWAVPGSNSTQIIQTQKYYLDRVLNVQESNNDLGSLHWPVVGCLALGWFITFLTVTTSIKSLGKLFRIIVPCTYVLLLALIISVLILPGANNGLIYFMTPSKNVGTFPVWNAALQAMMTIKGIGIGYNILSGSYSRYQSPAHIDCLVVSLVTLVISLMACLFFFAGIGVLAHNLNLNVITLHSYIETRKFDLNSIFVIYPLVLNQLPSAPSWYVIFFLEAFILAITSIIAIVSMISRSLYALFPRFRLYPALTSAAIVIPIFLLCLPFVTRNGAVLYGNSSQFYWIQGVVVIFEVLAFVYCYGMKTLRSDLEFMLHYNPNIFYRIAWLLTPFVTAAFMIYDLSTYKHDTLREYPLIVWSLILITLLPIPVFAVQVLLRYHRRGDIRGAFRPRSADELEREHPTTQLSLFTRSILSNSSRMSTTMSTNFQSSFNIHRMGLTTTNIVAMERSSTPNMRSPGSKTTRKLSGVSEESSSSVDSVMDVSTNSEEAEPPRENAPARMKRRALKNMFYEPYEK